MNASLPTPYPDLNAILEDFAASVQTILAANFVGLYLQGSFAVGDFDRHSDVDFIVVTARDLSEDELSALQALHARLYDRDNPWAKHLEGSYFPRDVLRDPAQCGSPLWFLDHGARQMQRSNHCNTLVVRWALHTHGIALAGPPPSAQLDPVTDGALRAEVAAVMRDWGAEILAEPDRFANRFYQSFIVLSYCRMLHTLDEGIVGSKRAGAAWTQAHLDPAWAGLIDRTWAGRIDPARSSREPANPDEFAATLAFVRYAIGLIPRYYPGGA